MSDIGAGPEPVEPFQGVAGEAPLDAWPSEPKANGASVQSNGNGNGKRRPRGSRTPRTVTTSADHAISFREYLQYRELFHNLTLRELRSKYKRSVIG
ncbi:MAG TPA: hypothetical protein VMF65_10170, partial [Acidimicrobiales bacterium]|nr:hypothetical protein [Acidimicrobiales bacterium]